MNRLQMKVRSALAAKGLKQSDLANLMNISSSALSITLSSNMSIKKALLLADSLNYLTNETLTLDDFRRDQSC